MLFNLSSTGGGSSGANGGGGSNNREHGTADHILDNMSTTGSIISTASMTNGVSAMNGSAASAHLNGMQTLPHVRNGGTDTSAGSVVVNGNSTLESPKHHTTTNGIVSAANGSSAVSSATTNGTANSAGSANTQGCQMAIARFLD